MVSDRLELTEKRLKGGGVDFRAVFLVAAFTSRTEPAGTPAVMLAGGFLQLGKQGFRVEVGVG